MGYGFRPNVNRPIEYPIGVIIVDDLDLVLLYYLTMVQRVLYYLDDIDDLCTICPCLAR
jgi:hypothetical protein